MEHCIYIVSEKVIVQIKCSPAPLSFRCSSFALHRKTHRNLSAFILRTDERFFVRSERKIYRYKRSPSAHGCRWSITVCAFVRFRKKKTELRRFRFYFYIIRISFSFIGLRDFLNWVMGLMKRASSSIEGDQERRGRINQSRRLHPQRCGCSFKGSGSIFILAFTHVTVAPATESIYTIALVILNSSWCLASNYTDESPKDRVVIWISPGDALAPSLNYIQLCDCTVSKEK